MALLFICVECGRSTLHNNNGQCLNCLTQLEKEKFEEWKSDKTLEERVDDLYWMNKRKQDKETLF